MKLSVCFLGRNALWTWRQICLKRHTVSIHSPEDGDSFFESLVPTYTSTRCYKPRTTKSKQITFLKFTTHLRLRMNAFYFKHLQPNVELKSVSKYTKTETLRFKVYVMAKYSVTFLPINLLFLVRNNLSASEMSKHVQEQWLYDALLHNILFLRQTFRLLDIADKMMQGNMSNSIA